MAFGGAVLFEDIAGEPGGGGHLGEAVADDIAGFFFYLFEGGLDDRGRDLTDDGRHFPCSLFPGDGGVVYIEFAMKGLQLIGPGRIIGGDTYEFAGREHGDLAGGYGPIELEGLACRGVAAVGADGGSLLENPGEAVGKHPGGVAGNGAANDIPRHIEHGIGLVASVYCAELAEVLDTNGDSHLIFPADGYGRHHTRCIEGCELVGKDMTRMTAGTIDHSEHPGNIQTDDSSERLAFLRVRPQTKDFWLIGVIDIQAKVVFG